MASQTVRLIGPSQVEYAKKCVEQAPRGYVVKIAAETRRDAQNSKLWPMLQELQRQVPGMATYTTEDIKLRFLNQLGTELRFLPEIEGGGMFPVGMKSSTLTVEQFSGLIELINAYGSRHGVAFQDGGNQ